MKARRYVVIAAVTAVVIAAIALWSVLDKQSPEEARIDCMNRYLGFNPDIHDYEAARSLCAK
jgi:hypothetical protein